MKRPRPLFRVLLRGLQLSLLLLGIFAASNWWVLHQSGPQIAHSAAKLSPRTAAIVPGAMVFQDRPSLTLRDRLSCALELFEAGKVEWILVSGDHGRPGYNEVHAMKKWLVDRGVPSELVVQDHAGFRTLDTMQRAEAVFGVKSAVICTQGFHLPRSLFLARRAGMNVSGLVADKHIYAAHHVNAWRERIARTAAVVDSYVLRTEPRFFGAVESTP